MTSTDNTHHILLVDDEEDQFLLARVAFEMAKLSHALHYVRNGLEGMNYLLQHQRPDLILLDLNMPIMDGKEFLKKMRAHAFLNHIPVVVLSNSDEHNDILQAYQLGANAYLVKPSGIEEMVRQFHTLDEHWFRFVKLPTPPHGAPSAAWASNAKSAY